MEGSQLEDMMQSQYRVSLLSPGVSKILTACRFKKTLMLGYVQKAEMHSFPNMPIMGGVALVEVEIFFEFDPTSTGNNFTLKSATPKKYHIFEIVMTSAFTWYPLDGV